jgi:hypothetical protein
MMQEFIDTSGPCCLGGGGGGGVSSQLNSSPPLHENLLLNNLTSNDSAIIDDFLGEDTMISRAPNEEDFNTEFIVSSKKTSRSHSSCANRKCNRIGGGSSNKDN